MYMRTKLIAIFYSNFALHTYVHHKYAKLAHARSHNAMHFTSKYDMYVSLSLYVYAMPVSMCVYLQQISQ